MQLLDSVIPGGCGNVDSVGKGSNIVLDGLMGLGVRIRVLSHGEMPKTDGHETIKTGN